MAQVVPSQFRPTIIISIEPQQSSLRLASPTVVTDDEAFYQMLSDLFISLDPALLPCVSLFTLRENESLSRTRRLTPASPPPSSEEREFVVFSERFRAAIQQVMGAVNIQQVENAGFAVPITAAQVFIVARTASGWASQVATWVYDLMRELRLKAFVGFLLMDAPHFEGATDHDHLTVAPADAPNDLADLGNLSDLLHATGDDTPDAPPILDDGLGSLGSEPAGAGLAADGVAAPEPAPMRRRRPAWTTPLAPGGDMPPVNFCFIFQDWDDRKTFLPLTAVRYVMAEALVALTTTSVTAAASFCEATHVSPSIRPEEVDQRIGSVATSMILFPRAAAERFCCARFGAELMEECARLSTRGKLTREERTTTEAEAKRFAERTRSALADTETRPGLEELIPEPDGDDYQWPGFAPLVTDDEHTQLSDAIRRIFEPLTIAGVEDRLTEPLTIAGVEDRLTKRESFARTLRRCQGEAIRALNVWRERSETVAGAGRERFLSELDQTMADLWLRDDRGADRARTYAERLDRAFDKLSERLSAWRIQHEKVYHARLAYLADAAEGPWARRNQDQTEPGATPRGPSASPTLSGADLRAPAYVPNQGPFMPPPTTEASTDGGENAANTTAAEGTAEPLPPLDPTAAIDRNDGDDLPERLERQIIPNLSRRLDVARAAIPTLTNLIAANAVAALPLLLLLFTLLPASWRSQPLLEGAACVVVLGGMTFASWRYSLAARLRVEQAELDLVEAYRVHYLYLAREWEDQLRIIMLSPLARRVKRMRERLEEINAFFTQAAKELEREAQRTEKDLFNGPQSLRDVFIANRKELLPSSHGHRPGSYHLGDFYQEVRKRALASGDANASALNGRLRAYFATAGVNVFGLNNAEISEQITRFSEQIIAPTLTGELVSVGAALTASGGVGARIWRKAQGKATMLYRPYNNAPILTYIAGRDEDRATIPAMAIPNATTMISTQETEWILIARLWTGGASTPWGAWSHLDRSVAPMPQELLTPTGWRDDQN